MAIAMVSNGTPHSVDRYHRGRTRVMPVLRSSSSNSARIGSSRVPSMVSPRSLIGVDHRFVSWNRLDSACMGQKIYTTGPLTFPHDSSSVVHGEPPLPSREGALAGGATAARGTGSGAGHR